MNRSIIAAAALMLASSSGFAQTKDDGGILVEVIQNGITTHQLSCLNPPDSSGNFTDKGMSCHVTPAHDGNSGGEHMSDVIVLGQPEIPFVLILTALGSDGAAAGTSQQLFQSEQACKQAGSAAQQSAGTFSWIKGSVSSFGPRILYVCVPES